MARIVIDLDSRGPLQTIIVAEAIQAVLGLSSTDSLVVIEEY